MPSRHAFAHVLATALIAIAAALLHPLLDAAPKGEPGVPGTGGYGTNAGAAAQGR